MKKYLIVKDWESLWRMAHLQVVQMTVLVPIFGYLILFSDWFTQHLEIDSASQIWKLHFLYYGFTSLAIGTILFNITCPSQIRNHGNVADYVDKDLPTMHRNSIRSMLLCMSRLFEVYEEKVENISHVVVQSLRAIIVAESADNKEKVLVPMTKELSGVSANNAEKRENVKAALIQNMVGFFELLNVSKETERKWITCFYTGGLILIFVPSFTMLLEILGKSGKLLMGWVLGLI